MILRSDQIKAHSKEVGAKTLNLLTLVRAGFEVPPFLAISSTSIPALLRADKNREENAIEIHKQMNCEKYVVRSSALIEDSASQSFAGQFHTEINVSPEALPQAIHQVLLQAEEKKGISKFSLIIQQFIEPDLAGVTFTRNPLGGREMIIETYEGRGEALVSGKIEPDRFSFYSFQKPPSNFPLNEGHLEAFKKIESLYDFPQDIEWCLKDGKLYFLQTRPITTLSVEQFEGFKTLENLLPKDEPYFFEKTEIYEIAPRPKPFLMSILQAIYSQGGPVAEVYSEASILYEDTNFLKLIGNELYIDKEKELRSLLPSYSTLKNDFSPHFFMFRGLGRTLKNILSLAKLKGDKPRVLQALKEKLSSLGPKSTLKAELEDFLLSYKIIFEINLLAGTSIKKLEEILKREKLSVLEALAFPKTLFLNEEELPNVDFSGKNLVGNSLNIEDSTPFSKVSKTNVEPDMALWESLPNWKRKYLKPFISEALFWQQLREIGRWLTVKKINALRNILLKMAEENEFKDCKNIYFFNLDELKNSKLDEKIGIERKKEYETYTHFQFPEKITDRFQFSIKSLLAVSPGVATGTLVDLESLSDVKGKKILYTESLLPELTQYFDEIEGILSKTGGLLSHLAIVAREKGLPVITHVDLLSEKLELGNLIEFNADKGEIKKITS